MTLEITKQCSKCGEVKTFDQFFKHHKVRWRSQCKTCMLQYNQKWDNENITFKMWFAAKTRATKKKLPFDIEVSDIVIPTLCPVLGIELHRIKSGRGVGQNPASPSLDRIIPHLGYVKGNVRVISFRANVLKNDASVEELEKILADSRQLILDSLRLQSST